MASQAATPKKPRVPDHRVIAVRVADRVEKEARCGWSEVFNRL
jgi:hypothetical protein